MEIKFQFYVLSTMDTIVFQSGLKVETGGGISQFMTPSIWQLEELLLILWT